MLTFSSWMEHSSPHYDISCLLPNSQVGAGCFQEKYQLFASTNLPVMFGLMGFILKFIFMIISKPSLDVIKADFSCPPKKSRDDFFLWFRIVNAIMMIWKQTFPWEEIRGGTLSEIFLQLKIFEIRNICWCQWHILCLVCWRSDGTQYTGHLPTCRVTYTSPRISSYEAKFMVKLSNSFYRSFLNAF